MTNRKSHTPFRLVSKSTTLDDLEQPTRILFQKRCVFRSPPQKNWMKIDPYCQQQKCRPLTLVSGDVRCVRIFAGVLWREASNDSGVIENVDFHRFWTLPLRHLRKWDQHYYTLLFSPLPPFQWPQNIWPWMTLTGYLALNSVFVPVWLAETARIHKIIAWKLIKIDTYCHQCRSSAWTLVSGDIRFVQIFGRVP